MQRLLLKYLCYNEAFPERQTPHPHSPTTGGVGGDDRVKKIILLALSNDEQTYSVPPLTTSQR